MSISTTPQFTVQLNLPAESGGTDVAHANRALLHETYQKIIAGDKGALVAILHPDILFREAAGLPYGVEARGIDATVAGVTNMLSAWRKLHVEIHEFLAGGDLVIAYMTMTCTAAATGETYQGPTAEYFRFRDGKIIEWWPIYWDTHAVRIACGGK